MYQFKLKSVGETYAQLPVLADNRIYTVFLLDYGSLVVCLSEQDLTCIWQADFQGQVSEVFTPSGFLFVLFRSGLLLSLNKITGEIISQFHLKIEAPSIVSEVVEDKFILSGMKGQASCFDLKKGKEIWTTRKRKHAFGVLIQSGRVYQANTYKLRCLNFRWGFTLWARSSKTKEYLYWPTYLDGLVVIGGQGIVRFYESRSGKVVHQINVEGKVERVIHEQGVLYFSAKTKLYSYEMTVSNSDNIKSNLQWEYVAKDYVSSVFSVVNEHVYFLFGNRVVCLNKKTGDSVWEQVLSGKKGLGITIRGNHIYTALNDGYVHKIENCVTQVPKHSDCSADSAEESGATHPANLKKTGIHKFMQKYISDQQEARFSYFSSIGSPDDDVWMPVVNPMFMGGPAWPTRPGWRCIRTDSSTIIVSDGLSNPFEGVQRNYGFGIEILCETSDQLSEDVWGSWLFHLVHEISQNAANHGQFRQLIEAHEVGTMEIYPDILDLAPMKNDNGAVGVLLGQLMPDRQAYFPTPAGDVLVITAKLLTLAELEYVKENGSAGYKTLRQLFEDSGSHHMSSLSRTSHI